MTEHLSAAWLADAAARFDAVRLDPPAAPPGLVIEVTVVDDSGAEEALEGEAVEGEAVEGEAVVAEFALDIDGDRIHLRVGGATGSSDRPHVRLRTDRDIARRIATGALSAQRAFMAGSLRLGGDVTQLLAHREVLASVGDVLADLRPPA